MNNRRKLASQRKLPNLDVPRGYRPQALDISVEADLLDFYKLRQLSVAERVAYAADLINKTRAFSLACLSQQFSHLSADGFARKLAEAWLQEDCPPGYAPKGNKMTWIQNSPELAVQLHQVFEQNSIPYFIVGGLAAIAYGDPRTTRDLDAVIQAPAEGIERVKSALEEAGFYVAGAEDAGASSLQITSRESIARADLIIAPNDEYTQKQFERRRRYTFPGMGEIYLASPKDIVIGKLRWGLTSDSQKQQRDILAIFKVQQTDINYQYIYYWADRFDLAGQVEPLTVAAGVQEVANKQWGERFYQIAKQLFDTAKETERIIVSESGEEVALGRCYDLNMGSQNQLTIVDSTDGRLIVQFDRQGQVVMAAPTLSDRRQWRETAQRMRKTRGQ